VTKVCTSQKIGRIKSSATEKEWKGKMKRRQKSLIVSEAPAIRGAQKGNIPQPQERIAQKNYAEEKKKRL